MNPKFPAATITVHEAALEQFATIGEDLNKRNLFTKAFVKGAVRV